MAMRWLVLPPLFLVFCVGVGALSAWADHGVGLRVSAVTVATLATLCAGAISASILLAKELVVRFVLSVCFSVLGLFPTFMGALHVACGVYHACF